MGRKQATRALISTGPCQSLVEGTYSLAQHKASSYVCFAEMHMMMEAYKDRSFGPFLNQAHIVTPDGCSYSTFPKQT